MPKTELPSPPLLPAAWCLAKDDCPYSLMYERDERGDVYSWAPLYDQAVLDEAVAAALDRRREYDDALVAAGRERWMKAATAALEVLDDLPAWSNAAHACQLLREVMGPNAKAHLTL